MESMTLNSVSGGRTSSYMAIHYPADINIFACVCIDYPEAAPKDDAVKKYCIDKLNGNFIASAEDEKSLLIMMQLEQLLGKEIIWVRGKSFDAIIDEAGCLPTWNRRFCTTFLKIFPIFEYCYFKYGIVTEQIGYRYDEFHRAYSIEKGSKPQLKIKSIWKNYPISTNNFGRKRNNLEDIHWANKSYPLIENKITREPINKYWSSVHPEFDFPEDSNCKGCHHKSKIQIKRNRQTNPDILQWFANQEKKKKFNTWHDDTIPYEQIFKMNFTELIDFPNGSCDSGYCIID